jgi:hypothetical protein
MYHKFYNPILNEYIKFKQETYLNTKNKNSNFLQYQSLNMNQKKKGK